MMKNRGPFSSTGFLLLLAVARGLLLVPYLPLVGDRAHLFAD